MGSQRAALPTLACTPQRDRPCRATLGKWLWTLDLVMNSEMGASGPQASGCNARPRQRTPALAQQVCTCCWCGSVLMTGCVHSRTHTQ